MYTEMISKFEILARRQRKFLCLERATIAVRQGASEEPKICCQSDAAKNQILKPFRYNSQKITRRDN